MAVVLKWKADGQYLSDLAEVNGKPAMKWSARRRDAIRFPSRAVALSRIETHFGRPIEVIRHEARFVRLAPKRRAVASGAPSAPASLPKPARVEPRHRWACDFRDIDGSFPQFVVDAVDGGQVRLIGGPRGVSYKPTSEMLGSLRWIFLGPASQESARERRADEPSPVLCTDSAATISRTYEGVTITAPGNWTLADLARVVRSWPALRVAFDAEVKRAVEEARDAAYHRGQEEMRERAASLVDEAVRKEPNPQVVFEVWAARDAIRSLPIANAPTASTSDGAGEAPSDMRIERRCVEYLVGAVNGGTDGPGNGCGESGGPVPGYNCTYHFGGEHLATFPSDGAEEICARWPIAPSTEAT